MVGEPCGICSTLWQIPVLVWMSAGVPLISTRVAGTSQRAVTQGCGLVPVPMGIWNGQPATVPESASVATGIPLTSTREFDEITVICPA
jgi:hypothetical protein